MGKMNLAFIAISLYPPCLCRGVYSFRLSVRHVRGIYHKIAWKFLKWGISQLFIRKHSYLDLGRSASLP